MINEEQYSGLLMTLKASQRECRDLEKSNATLCALVSLIHANAGESPEWIRARIEPVIAKAVATHPQA